MADKRSINAARRVSREVSRTGFASSRKRCVSCMKYKPVDGKLLHCLHILCGSCLNESLTAGGGAGCVICPKTTVPPLASVDLRKQLADSRPFLYPNTASSVSSIGEGEEQDITLYCELCDDDELREATYECVSCDGAALCEKHAVSHPKKRTFSGHTVQKLNVIDGDDSDGAPEYRCDLHNRKPITSYCHTCKHVVCEQCVTTGHKDHEVESVTAAADKQRAKLVEAVPRSPLTDASCDLRACDIIFPDAATVAKSLQEQLAAINTEVEEASKVIVRTYEQIEQLAKSKKEELLQEVDSLRWSQQEPLHLKHHRVDHVKEQFETAMELRERLAASTSSDVAVLRLTPLVEENLMTIARDIVAGQAGARRGRIGAVMMSTILDKIHHDLESLVRVTDRQVDIQKSSVTMPTQVTVGQAMTGFIALVDSGGDQISAHDHIDFVSARLKSPDGTESPVPITAWDDSSEGSKVKLSVSASTEGVHSLLFTSEEETKCARFEALPRTRFDSSRCSTRLSLSEDDHEAAYSHDGEVRSNVVGTVGYTSGQHRWDVEVFGQGLETGYLGVGVTTQPDDGDYQSDGFHLDEGYFWWSCPGTFGLARKQSASARTSPWKHGDRLSFTLDCEEKTLQLYLHRTKETRTLTKVDGKGEPLFLYVCLGKPDRMVKVSQKI